jgi:hypothetical protein
MTTANPSICMSERHPNTPFQQNVEPITYKVDKMTFIVTPIYRNDPGKTIHDLLVDLMTSNSESH